MREESPQTGPAISNAPVDLIAARGAFENYLYVVPDHNLVIARTAKPKPKDKALPRFEAGFWELMSVSFE